jgi:alpha-tubulin suppressor-like RCC1 family protein
MPRLTSIMLATTLAAALPVPLAAGSAGAGELPGRPAAASGLSLTGVTQVATGDGFFLALLGNGTVMAWGDNNVGQLGDGTATNSATPVPVSGLTGVTAISAGGFHSLALLSDGTVMAWGDDQEGQLGNGEIETDSDVPVPVTGLTGVTAVSAGLAHSLALLRDGTVMAWGLDDDGQLGTGPSRDASDVPELVQHLSGVTAVSAGSQHSLALLSDGTVMAWGSNSAGQLGNNDIEVASDAVPEPVHGLTGVTAISAGQDYSLALLGNGTAEAWGDDEFGELGNGLNPPFYAVPVKVSGLTTATALSAGDPVEADPISLALLSSHTVDAWGATPGFHEVPRPLAGVSGVVGISPGLFLLSNGTVEAYGPGKDGAGPRESLGHLLTAQPSPRRAGPAAGRGRPEGAAAGGSSAVAWGQDDTGQLGNGGTADTDVPGPVKGLAGVVQVSGGGLYSLALLANGTVRAWGDNEEGQLGDGSTTQRNLPVTVTGLTGVTAVSAGAQTSLAVLANGTVWAWGDNLSGELGNGSSEDQSDVPVQVSGISTATAVAAGDNFCLALLRDGTVMAWGDNSGGELGIGSSAQDSDVPVAIPGLSGVKAIAAGTLHALALLSDGTVMAWGENIAGELGTGEHGATESGVPVRVQAIRSAVGVAAGYEHSAAVLANGTVLTWGSNQFGQLGIATRNFLSSDDPIAAFRISGAASVSAGELFTVALLGSGTAAAWGTDSDGELGDGMTNDPEVPAPVSVSGLTGATQLSAGGGHVLAVTPG